MSSRKREAEQLSVPERMVTPNCLGFSGHPSYYSRGLGKPQDWAGVDHLSTGCCLSCEKHALLVPLWLPWGNRLLSLLPGVPGLASFESLLERLVTLLFLFSPLNPFFKFQHKLHIFHCIFNAFSTPWPFLPAEVYTINCSTQFSIEVPWYYYSLSVSLADIRMMSWNHSPTTNLTTYWVPSTMFGAEK